eukprot:TRINITY_DN396_c0_g1_i1.p1 TRINITY_DN396_c0_g1~~TRINITY_DN396_c0_g1_i1.p1  ORF type:complete len:221 (+),score=42.67 TRINITY_DN396_c0_g1_i1:169-831(+)
MTILTLKGKYCSKGHTTHATLGVWHEDVKLKAVITDSTVKCIHSGSMKAKGLELGIEKPGHFHLDHEIEGKVTRFLFHSHAVLASKPVKLTLIHHHGRPTSTLEAKLTLDFENKVVVKHDFHKNKPHFKFEHTRGNLTLEPSYCFVTDHWALGVKQKLDFKDHIKVSYQSKPKKAEFEWVKDTFYGGSMKVVAHVPLHSSEKPHIMFEKEWTFDFSPGLF